MEALDYAVGRIVGTALAGMARVAIPVAVVTGPSALMLWGLLPDRVKADLEDEGIDDVDALLTWLDRHPEIERHLLNGGGGLLDGLSDGAWPGPGGLPFLPPFHATTEDAARSLGGLFGDEVAPGVAEFDFARPSGPRGTRGHRRPPASGTSWRTSPGSTAPPRVRSRTARS